MKKIIAKKLTAVVEASAALIVTLATIFIWNKIDEDDEKNNA